MPESTIEAIRDNLRMSDLAKARELFQELKSIESEEAFAICLLYHVGVAEGKRAERARRKGGAV